MGDVEIIGLRPVRRRALTESGLRVGLATPDPVKIVADADDLGDSVEPVIEIRHDLRLELDRPGFARHMRGARLGDQPVIAAIDPGIEAVLAYQLDGLAGDVGRHRLLLEDRRGRA